MAYIYRIVNYRISQSSQFYTKNANFAPLKSQCMQNIFKHYINNLLPIIACATVILSLTGCSGAGGYKPQYVSGIIWGTSYNICYNADKQGDEGKVRQTIMSAMNRVDRAANAFDKMSETGLLNRTGRITNPSPEFLHLLDLSTAINHITGGAFEPTVGPLVDLWGFGITDTEVTPCKADIDSALTLIGMDKIKRTESDIQMLKPGMRLDLSAIAKGYGVDCVAQALEDCNISDYMVEIGGEVRVHGHNPNGNNWTIQIDAPVPDISGTHTRLALLQLCDAALATSGNYRNFRYTETGKLVYHTISPITGQPIQSDILSATVIAQNTAVADALATACMVLGMEESAALISRLACSDNPYVYGAVFVTAGSDTEPFVLNPVAINPERASLHP